MKCIFCQELSSDSTSVEHIVPESLGNKEYILGKGWVCDRCNNYFAVKIEQPVLNMGFFSQYRHDLDIQNKRKKIPIKNGFLIDEEISPIAFHKSPKNGETIAVEPTVVEKMIADAIEETPAITVTFGPPVNSRLVSRFLGKIGIELLAYEAIQYRYDESYYNQESLDNLKKYVRNGGKDGLWQYATRQLYNPEHGFKDISGYLKVICSWKFIYTSDDQLLFQFLFVGTEFTINLINPDTYSIQKWFASNNGRSAVLESLLKRYDSSK